MTVSEDTSEEGSGISESEMENYTEKIYKKLCSGNLSVQISSNSYRCPFCQGKKKQNYRYEDLLQHAKGVGAANRKATEKGCHQALAKFLLMDLAEIRGIQAPRVKDKPTSAPRNDEKYVWPWMGILVNIQTELKDGKFVGESDSKLRTKFAKYNPVKVHSLWNFQGHTGHAVVSFRKDWSGFKDAVAFAMAFEADHHGKMQWTDKKHRTRSVYGWIAGEDDYNFPGIIGNHLRRHGDLKTVGDLEQEEIRKTDKLVANLASEIDTKNKSLKELECKYNETSMSLQNVMQERDRLYEYYNEEIKRMQLEASCHLGKVYRENEKQRLLLEEKKRVLALRSSELDKREIQNENDRRMLDEEKTKNAAKNDSLNRAAIEQQKADEKVLRLVEEQKKVKKQVLDGMIQLERQLDAKQKLELDIEQLKGKLEVLKHMDEMDDSFKGKIDAMKSDLEEKEGEMEDLEALNQALIVKERRSNDELQEARKELIEGLTEMLNGKTKIGVKRMGELDIKTFHAACKRKFPADEADVQATTLVSSWEAYLRDPEWHPFKIMKLEGGNDVQEVVDEDDEKLKELRAAWDDDVCRAVKTALLEVNEYNPSGRYPIPELWHFKENRKASMKEVIQYIVTQWKIHKRKKVGG